MNDRQSLEERRRRLSPEQQALLGRRVAQAASAPVTSRQIPRRHDGTPAPLSSAQERLWFLNQFEPQPDVYNRPANLRLTGRLDAAALRRSLREIIRRHDTLRSHFPLTDGQPVLHVVKDSDFDVVDVDLRSVPSDVREIEARRRLNAENLRPFELASGPLVRATLLRLADDQHWLALTFHHIIFDGWSEGVLWRELEALYVAFTNGRSSPLPEIAIRYGDYAAWQRRCQQGEEIKHDLAYWSQQLGGATSQLQLPTDFPRPPMMSYRGGRHRLRLDGALVEALRELSRQNGATLFMALLAVFQMLLSRYGDQEDISVGTPIAGRTRPELEGVIGCFVNTLVLRTDLSGDPTFLQVLQRVRDVTLAAFVHQDVPFEKLIEELALERSLARTPLFEAMLVLRNTPQRPLDLPHLSASGIDDEPKTAKFDLTLALQPEGPGLVGQFEYAADLFRPETIAGLVDSLQVLLVGIVTNPDCRMSQLPLLTPTERHRILVEWNRTDTEYPRDHCVHELFEAQVARTPDAIAVVFEDQSLTYRELNVRANQLAHRLIGLAVRPDVLVALCVERSLEMIVGILGILKAGGAYVPLDPEYPAGRLSWMLADAAPAVMLTTRAMREPVPDGVKVILLDTGPTADESTPEPGGNPTNADRATPLLPRCSAYVIYTSGSTGMPKGVAIEHGALVNHMAWMSATYPVDQRDRVLLRTSISFDASVWEIWLSLISGATLCIASRETAREPSALMDFVQRSGITVAQFVPTLLAAACDQEMPRPDRLRLVFSGGEALPRELAQRVVTGWQVPLVNLYGPTETTIQVTHYACRDQVPETPTVPIGRPIGNTTVYVLDGREQPVPVGVPGELYIGGAGLARGYLHNPDLTAEKFRPDPFSAVAGARMYRTGDHVRWRADGNLEFLRRLDQQVKLRGFRIELGEVESVLAQHPHVRQAVVVVREDRPGDKRLVAYVVPQPAQTPLAIATLRRYLHDTLPDYMVPAAFVVLDTLPLTPSGKVDRPALPAPAWDRGHVEQTYVAPRTPGEELLAGIWGRVLRLDQVGIHDNFFELGGHSLLATQVISRVRDAFGVEVPVRTLFEAPTVAGLAAHLLRARSTETAVGSLPLRPVPRDRPLPLSFAQERLWFVDQFEPSAAYNIAWALRLHGPVHVPALERSLQEVVRRHEALRTSVVSVNGQSQPVLQEAAAFRLTVIELRTMPEAAREPEARRLAAQEAGRAFDLSRDIMLRAVLVRLADHDQVLVLTMHHIAADGWSLGVFGRELTALYGAFATGQPSPLPELPIQYADYAVWQRAWLQGAALERQLAYWTHQLAGAPAMLDLPTDLPRPPVVRYRGARQPVVLDAALTQAVHALSHREGVTPFMTLLAAFQVLLARYSGQNDVSVGAPIAGRSRTELEGLIGFFVNTLVLRTDLSGNPTCRELLARVREVTLGAYAHQDLPFEKLVEELRPERNLGHSPLFQVLFILQNTASSPLELTGVTVSRLALPNPTAKFDLTLSLGAHEGQFHGTLEYNTDIFQAETIARLLGHFEMVLAGLVANPGQRIGALPLLTETERQQLLVEWNRTDTEYPRDHCVHELFEAQVARTPDAIAVVFEDQSLTYRELNVRANQLAHHLIALAVGPDVLVGLCLTRSLEMIIGLLGILKAGGAYLPLDPSLPAERLGWLLEDSRVPALVTTAGLSRRLPPHAARVVELDDQEEWSSANPPSRASANDLAYVLYTSGSTGTPKGVETSHRAIVRLLFGVDYANMDASHTFLHLSPLSFDASTFEIWGALLHGARCVLFPEGLPTARDVGRVIERWQVDTLWLTAALFNTVMDDEPLVLRGIRQLLIGGEALSVPHVRVALTRLPTTTIVNGYGPTETTTFACTYGIPQSIQADISSIPIGRPIGNTTVYVLDGREQPVPVGVPGELYIGGAGLARGYLHNPDLTAEKFRPDPFSAVAGARMYRTGDHVRWRADGNLEFLRRLDQQVKLRGFRIELGEVEAVLAQHPHVRQAVVVVREDRPGDKRLVAYVVPQPAQTPLAIATLRRYLHDTLPDYMVPAAFVVLDTLPLTPSGKVDRPALPAPAWDRGHVEQTYVAPRTPGEELLAGIWGRVLRLDQVGIHDNFFELGGHSLLALKLLHQIEQTFRTHLSLREFFQAPTIADQSARVVDHRDSPTRVVLVHVRRPADGSEAARPPLLIIPSLFGDISGWQEVFQGNTFDRAVYGIEFHGSTAYPTENPVLEEIAADVADVVASQFSDRPVHLAGYSFGALLAYELGQQLRARKLAPMSIILVDANAYMPNGPLRFPDFVSMAVNLPGWLVNEWRVYGPVELWKRLRRRMPNEAATSTDGSVDLALTDEDQRSIKHLTQIFDWSSLPTLYRRRLLQSYRAIVNYRPQPTQNRVANLRSRVQKLIHRHRPDGGWGQYVPASLLVTYQIPGDHGSSLHMRWRSAFVAVLRQALDAAEDKRSSQGPNTSVGTHSGLGWE